MKKWWTNWTKIFEAFLNSLVGTEVVKLWPVAFGLTGRTRYASDLIHQFRHRLELIDGFTLCEAFYKVKG